MSTGALCIACASAAAPHASEHPAADPSASPPPAPAATSEPTSRASASSAPGPLGIERRIEGPPRAYLRVSNDVISWFDVTTPALLVYGPASNAPDAAIAIGSYLDSASYTDPFVDGSVVYLRHGVLHWLDLTTGRERFAVTLLEAPPLRPSDLLHATYELATNESNVLVALDLVTVPSASAEIVALARADGAIRWRVARPRPCLELATAGGYLFTREQDDALAMLDAATGAETWRVARRSPEGVDGLAVLLATETTLVLVQYDGAVEVRDPATGALRRELRLSGHTPAPVTSYGHPPGVVLDGTLLYVSVASATDLWLTAVDLDSGRTVWESSRVPYVDETYGLVGPLFVDRDAVYGCFGDGTLRAVERATGALVFQLGLGSCELAPLSPDASGLRSIVVRQRDDWFLLSHHAPALAPLERATVHGVVTRLGAPGSGARVVVHDRAVTADASGHFEVEVEGRGVLHVSTDEARAQVGASETVTLDGSGRYEVNLTIVPAPPIDF